MTQAPLRCRNCGATQRTPGRLEVCEFCAVALPREPEPVATSTRDFAALERHPEYELWLRTIPPALEPHVRRERATTPALVFAFVALVVFVVYARSGGARATFPFVAFVSILLLAFWRRRSRRRAPEATRAFGARLVDERTLVQTMGETTTTRYFVTLEEQGGQRAEYPVDGRTAGKLTREDLGVAYVRGLALVGFQRLV